MLVMFCITVLQSVYLSVAIFDFFHRFISKKLFHKHSKCLGLILCVFWYNSDLNSLSILWFYPILTLPRGSKDSTRWSRNLTRLPHFKYSTLILGVCKLIVPLRDQPATNSKCPNPLSDLIIHWDGLQNPVLLDLWSLFHYRGCRLLIRWELQVWRIMSTGPGLHGVSLCPAPMYW